MLASLCVPFMYLIAQVICLPCPAPTREAFDYCLTNNTKDIHVCADVRFEVGNSPAYNPAGV